MSYKFELSWQQNFTQFIFQQIIHLYFQKLYKPSGPIIMVLRPSEPVDAELLWL